MKHFIMITIALLLFIAQGVAQSISISLDTLKTYRNDSVTMPVNIAGFSNIGAITIYIQYDTNKLAWGRTLNWHTGLNGNIPLGHQKNGIIGISWIDVTGVTLTDGILFEMRFKHKQGHALLTIGNGTEFANPNGIVLSHTSSNGLIWEGLTLHPDTNQYMICLGSSIELKPKPYGGFGTLTYSWASIPPGFTSTLSTVTVNPSVTTTYTVSVTDGIDMQDTSFTVGIHPNISPAAPINMLPADSAIDLYNPFTFSWSPSLHATLYDLYVWPSSSSVPPQPTKGNISQINYPVSLSLTPGTWYNWKVVAKNDCYNTSSAIQHFKTRALPDLHVTAVTTSTPISGQPLTVTWTVTNDGQGPTTTPTWVDRIWIAPDFDIRIGETDDILLGQYNNVSALNPGASYINTQTVQIPPNLMGPYFLFVLSDMIDAYFLSNVVPSIPYNPPPFISASGQHGSGVVSEVPGYGNDNFFYVQLVFPVPPLADLVTTDLITPSAVFSGQPATIRYTVKNNGINNTPSGLQWYDKIWLTTDTIFNLQTAILLGTRNHQSPLLPDSTYIDSLTVNIPNNIYGTYYILVQNDATNQLFENIGEDNNFRFSDPVTVFLTPPADLIVSYITITDSASIRQSIPVSYSVINQGAQPTPATGHWDAFYLSTLDTFNVQHSIFLGRYRKNASLNIGTSYNNIFNVTIPESVNGSYYLYVLTDQVNEVFEHTTENNNSKRSDQPLTVLRPDFLPTAVTVPLFDSTGGSVPLTWRINNPGPGDHISGKYINTRVYISSLSTWLPDSMTPVISSSNTTPPIPSGGFVDMTAGFTIPDGKPGPFYVYVFCDHEGKIPETNENNNIARSTHEINIERPDLIVTSVDIPATLVSGDSAQISWTLKNNGAGHIVNKAWKDRIYMSRYATFHADSILYVGEFSHTNTNLNSGLSLSKSVKYMIPHGHSGTWYFYVVTDYYNNIYEKNFEHNNRSAASNPTTMTLGPWADLSIQSLILQDTATQGDVIPVSFSINNTGTKTAYVLHGWMDRLYLSSSPVWNSSNLTNLNTQHFTAALLPDSSYTVQVGVNISLNVAEGFYYLYLFTDCENRIYEYINESNNILRSTPIYIQAYPPIDLTTTATSAPSAANSGNSIIVSWSVQNIGGGTTLAANWYDGIYLSQDPVFSSATDVLLTEKKRNGPLVPGNSYSTTQQVTIPNGYSGTWYILVVADRMDVHHDINRLNNTGTPQPIAITLTPSPDLIIADYSAPVSAVSGQPVTITWKVSNAGAGPTLSSGWIDRFYISSDYVIDQNDKILGSKAYTGSLGSGMFYADTAEFFIPSLATGNYILIIKTDNNNVEYEHNAENNNTVSGMLFINQPPPADLQVTAITKPDSALAGDQVTIGWSVKNFGSNPAAGWMKDNIYLSQDTSWEVTDLLIGSVFSQINIQPLFELNRSITFPLPGLTPGHYHVIVRTDVSNNINETSETNNQNATQNTLFIDVPDLPFEVLTNDTLFNMTDIHYRIIVPDSLIGESMITFLTGDSAHGVNELYLTHNQISSRISFDYMHTTPYQANQEVLVPTLDSGAYYLLAYGYNPVQSYQEISLLADILEFDIRQVHDDKGGNTGMATLLLLGSKFDSLMTVYLDSNGIIIPATELHFIDITKSLVTFNLEGAMLGMYDVVAINKSGDTAIVEEGFRVIQGEAPFLGVNILHPANSRPHRISAFTIEFGNLGNIDLIAPVLKVESLVGAPIAYDPGGLSANNTVMLVPLSIPGEPPGILRPGVSGSITIYTKSTHGLGFLITRQ